MYRIVKQAFGAHNRASAQKYRAPAQMNFFSFEMRNQSLDFTARKVGLQIRACQGFFFMR